MTLKGKRKSKAIKDLTLKISDTSKKTRKSKFKYLPT